MHGVDWFMGGVEILKRSPSLMVLLGVGVILGTVMISLIPGIGSFVVQLVAPVFVVGLAQFCARVEREPVGSGSSSWFSDVLVGFKGPVEKLVVVGVVQLLGSLGIVMLTLIPALVLIFLNLSSSDTGVSQSIQQSGGVPPFQDLLVRFLVGGKAWLLFISFFAFLFLYIPLSLATWFAPQLIFFKNLAVRDALLLSLKGSFENIGAMGVYGAVWLLVGVMATLPLALGWFVCVPILIGSSWVAYREIYGDSTHPGHNA